MKAYRICHQQYSKDLSGTGAALYGGRWNKIGTPVLYCSLSKELALLEFMIQSPQNLVPNLDILSIDIPDNEVSEIPLSDLPPNWKDYPAPAILAEMGDEWVRDGKTLAIKVPSCIIYSSYNLVVNCQHPKFSELKVITCEPFYLDPRWVG